MRIRGRLGVIFSLTLVCVSSQAVTSVEKMRNEKVVVFEETLQPGEVEAQAPTLPSVIVYISGEQVTRADNPEKSWSVRPGFTSFADGAVGRLRNAGSTPLHFARIEFLTSGTGETWGTSGLSPHYVLLLENRYARAYDIKIPAHTREPQHTHHDRVVVSLEGAQLEHILPSGQIQPSTLQTGEIVWRLGATHIGHNLGETDLWVIAVEPK